MSGARLGDEEAKMGLVFLASGRVFSPAWKRDPSSGSVRPIRGIFMLGPVLLTFESGAWDCVTQAEGPSLLPAAVLLARSAAAVNERASFCRTRCARQDRHIHACASAVRLSVITRTSTRERCTRLLPYLMDFG